ncbi:MAG: DUF2314 domain-containing protein [Chloroflexi bacterium]|nr:DUF2314 domain-containing protein [Chloroflexota bacterium]
MRFILSGCLLLFLTAACAPAKTAEPSAADEDFATAVDQAHQTLDVFIRNLQSPQSNQSLFALKVHFDYPDGTSEEIWVDDVYYEAGQFQGVLFDASSKNLGFRSGDRVKIPEEDILDWMFLENNVLVGGYTIRLAFERMSPAEQEAFLKDADYQIK